MNFREEDILREELSRVHPGLPKVTATSCAGIETLFFERCFGYGQSMAIKSFCAREAIVMFMKKTGFKPVIGPIYANTFQPRDFDASIFPQIEFQYPPIVLQSLLTWSERTTEPRAIYPTEEIEWSNFSSSAKNLFKAIGATPYSTAPYFGSISDEPRTGRTRVLLAGSQKYMQQFEQLRELQFFSKTFIRELYKGSQNKENAELQSMCKNVLDMICASVEFIGFLLQNFREPNVKTLSQKLFRTIYDESDTFVEYVKRFPQFILQMETPDVKFDSRKEDEILDVIDDLVSWTEKLTVPRAVSPTNQIDMSKSSLTAKLLFETVGANPYSTVPGDEKISDEPTATTTDASIRLTGTKAKQFDALREKQFFSKTFIRQLYRGYRNETNSNLRETCKRILYMISITIMFIDFLLQHFNEADVTIASQRMFHMIYNIQTSIRVHIDRFPSVIRNLKESIVVSQLKRESILFGYVAVFNPYNAFFRNALQNISFVENYVKKAVPVIDDDGAVIFPMAKKFVSFLAEDKSVYNERRLQYYETHKKSLRLASNEVELKDALEVFRRPIKGFITSRFVNTSTSLSRTEFSDLANYLQAVWEELQQGKRFSVGDLASWAPCYMIQKEFLSQFESSTNNNTVVSSELYQACLHYEHKRNDATLLGDLDVLITRTYLNDSIFWGKLKTSCPYHHLLVDHQYTKPMIEWEGHDVYLERSDISSLMAVVDPAPGSVMLQSVVERLVVTYNDQSGDATEKGVWWVYGDAGKYEIILKWCMMMLRSKNESAFTEAVAAACLMIDRYDDDESFTNVFYPKPETDGTQIPFHTRIAINLIKDSRMILLSLDSEKPEDSSVGSFQKILHDEHEKMRSQFDPAYNSQVEKFIANWGPKLEIIALFPTEVPSFESIDLAYLNRVLRQALIIYEPNYFSTAPPVMFPFEGMCCLSRRFYKILGATRNESVINSRFLSDPRLSGSDYYYRSCLMKMRGVVHCNGKFMHPYSVGDMDICFKKPTPMPSRKRIPWALSTKLPPDSSLFDEKIRITRVFLPVHTEINFYHLPIEVQVYALAHVCKTHAFVNGFYEIERVDEYYSNKDELKMELHEKAADSKDDLSPFNTCVSKLRWFTSNDKFTDLFYQVVTEYTKKDFVTFFSSEVLHDFQLSFKEQGLPVTVINLRRRYN